MLGFTAENILTGLVSFISCAELDELSPASRPAQDMTILDVREEIEFLEYHIRVPSTFLSESFGEDWTNLIKIK